MYIIRPVQITDAMLTASNVTEADYTAWNAATAYTAGDRCIKTTGIHKIYEAIVNVTGGSSPEVDVLAAVPKWLEISATNRWKAFDQMVGSQTSQATSITYTITPGEIFDSIAFLDLDAESVQIVITSPTSTVGRLLEESGGALLTEDGNFLGRDGWSGSGEVYNETIDLLSTVVVTGESEVYDWYTYFFSSYFRIVDLVRMDITPYLNAVVYITITYTGGTAKVGGIILGLKTFLGATQYGASIGIHDYSTKNVDDFGIWSVTERAFSKTLSCDIAIDNRAMSNVQRLLASYRATPIVWVASEDYAALIVFGFFKDFNIVISQPAVSECSIEIEGLS